MATQSERKALIFLAAVACLGVGARVARSRGDAALAAAGPTPALDGQLRAVDSAQRAGRGRGKGGDRAGRRRADSAPGPAGDRSPVPPAATPPPDAGRPWIVGRLDGGALGVVVPGRARSVESRETGAESRPPLDLDVASVTDIEALPGIGPAMARRIVADREARGTFGSIDALTDVPGIGKRMVERLAPIVTFSGARRPLNAVPAGASGGSEKRRRGRARASP